ncbi:MAG: hypothetical protein KIT22_01480 [Verrucomicrobiae bacterium]|nr:hypothetical protein [Verrucomicrobiae bacterium]
MKRFDESDDHTEASFQVAFTDIGQVEACLQISARRWGTPACGSWMNGASATEGAAG